MVRAEKREQREGRAHLGLQLGQKGKRDKGGGFCDFSKTTFEALLFSGFEPTINSDKNLNLSP